MFLRSEDSSSDESFSRTDFSRTDIESPSPPSRPKNKAPWLYPSDIQIDPSSLESSPKTSQAAGPSFPLLDPPPQGPSNNHQLLRLPTVGQSPSPAHHDEFRSEVESELDFDDNLLPGDGDRGAGEQLATRLELPPGVTGAESCRSAMSSPMESNYIGDSCGSFEFLPKESPLRRVLRAATTEDKDTPPRDIKKEIERRAAEIEEQREAESKAANVELEVEDSAKSLNSSHEGRRSSGSDRRSSGGHSGSEGRRRRRKVSNTEADPLPGTKEEGDGPRPVQHQVLAAMARDIRPPPLEQDEVRSPRGKQRPRGKEALPQGYGPLPSFEREVQRILAEKEKEGEVATEQEQKPQSQAVLQASPAKRKEELVEKLVRLNSRYVAPAPGQEGKVGQAHLAPALDPESAPTPS